MAEFDTIQVRGIDFTSTPSRKKPLTCATCTLSNKELRFERLEEWTDFAGFERALQSSGPWIAGIDFPFGLSRRFIENIGWPTSWSDYVRHAKALGREGFRKALEDYKTTRPNGDKEHRRKTDKISKSISPQKLYGVPVGLMLFEGAPRLVESGVFVPFLQPGDMQRTVVEAYPGVLARSLIGRLSYKNDSKSKQTLQQYQARTAIFDGLTGRTFVELFDLQVNASKSLCDDPTGDSLDALLCAVQAAWAWQNRNSNFGAPDDVDALEGWIAHPFIVTSPQVGTVQTLRGVEDMPYDANFEKALKVVREYVRKYPSAMKRLAE